MHVPSKSALHTHKFTQLLGLLCWLEEYSTFHIKLLFQKDFIGLREKEQMWMKAEAKHKGRSFPCLSPSRGIWLWFWGWAGNENTENQTVGRDWPLSQVMAPQASFFSSSTRLPPCHLAAFLTNSESPDMQQPLFVPLARVNQEQRGFQSDDFVHRDLWNAKDFLLPFSEQTAEGQEFGSPHPQVPDSLPFPPPGISPPGPSSPQVHYRMTVPPGSCNLIFNLFLQGDGFSGAHFWETIDVLGLIIQRSLFCPWPATLLMHPRVSISSLFVNLLSLAALLTLPLLSRFLNPSLPQITHVFRDHCSGHGHGLLVHVQSMSLLCHGNNPNTPRTPNTLKLTKSF